jgi:hypothetical protein
MANIRPLGDRILVKPIEQEAETESGLLLPETAKEKPQEGEVVAVGAGKPRRRWRPYCAGCRGRQPCYLRQVRWHRSQAGRRKDAHYEGKRHTRHCRVAFSPKPPIQI